MKKVYRPSIISLTPRKALLFEKEILVSNLFRYFKWRYSPALNFCELENLLNISLMIRRQSAIVWVSENLTKTAVGDSLLTL